MGPRHLVNRSGLYYKHMTIVNDDSSVVNKLEALLTDDAKSVIYDRRKFIIQATGYSNWPTNLSMGWPGKCHWMERKS